MTNISIYTKNPTDKEFYTAHLANKATLHFYEVAAEPPHPDTEVLSVFTDVPVGRELIESLPKLQLIAVRATGVDHIDTAAAQARQVAVAHVSGYGSSTVAEYTITLLLMLARKMPTVMRESARSTPERSTECGIDLHGKTLGVIGTGAMGIGVAKIATGMGMHVIGYDTYPNTEKANEAGLTYCDTPDEVLQRSDAVSLHMPLLDSTRHFMTSERFAAMKPGALFVNTARGELVVTKALIEALQGGKLGGAALDVVEDGEHGQALGTMDNVIVTNHNAYNTVEAIERINQKTLENITHFLEGTAFDQA